MNLLDLGCGWGSLALFVAERFPRCHVTAVSNSKSQGELIRRRADLLGLERVRVVTADKNTFEPGERFDRVVSNPPFHAGNDILLPLVDEAYAHLRVHGRLYVVIMRYAGVMKHMDKVFGNATIASASEKHVVLMSERTR